MKQGKHVVFYREEPDGILICRILHQSMLPEMQAVTADSLMWVLNMQTTLFCPGKFRRTGGHGGDRGNAATGCGF